MDQRIQGRKKSEIAGILEKFYRKNSRHPKKEYLNVLIIRAIERAFRVACRGEVPHYTLIAIHPGNANEMAQ